MRTPVHDIPNILTFECVQPEAGQHVLDSGITLKMDLIPFLSTTTPIYGVDINMTKSNTYF